MEKYLCIFNSLSYAKGITYVSHMWSKRYGGVYQYLFLRTYIFKGCDNLSKEENKVCFEKKMKQFVQRNFDVELANEIGLGTGKHKIYTQFVIDDKGEIVDVKIRTAYKTLEKEALRVIKKLPKFKPGIQNSKTVKVRYNLPISFSLE